MTCYRNIFPSVREELYYWENYAHQIPNEELKQQALASIDTKTFHCEGGAIYACLANQRRKDAVRFIVAYQTISDYLDNLCDRSTSMNPDDFRALHDSMLDALCKDGTVRRENYYELREDQDDAGYLRSLVDTCQSVVQSIPNYEHVYPHVKRLADLYVDLQVHKHVRLDERVPRLTNWYDQENNHDFIHWNEFSAVTGSTIGIFTMISYALDEKDHSSQVMESYFPYMQGLHILLDYFIDQTEDEDEGDLNFCHYYKEENEAVDRLKFFINGCKESTQKLPDQTFHELIVTGLVGLYLSDLKVDQLPKGKLVKRELLKHAGQKAKWIYWNGRMYRKWKKRKGYGA
ncbi:tetraprenyl-beta-curcumene synthase family protein [Filobacillus milosensis]|uniref:Tetraprenyl-beta-curcumene synthase family protein n=1 Tax=Filobacillus milosensis TaxID=94137 RepID=A0A4Y8IJQ2_9BACI|nr:tetraprenyl-beta-curcumene synthase family protein [Filobacillus milosensis]TFB13809.1 tetraprenyl-beta-curcumene synthase family protein [Filobacillus milosensis]